MEDKGISKEKKTYKQSSEKALEIKLNEEVKKRGGMSLKLDGFGKRGIPDRLLLFKGGKMVFAEVKSSDGKLSDMQAIKIQALKKLGFKVWVIKFDWDIECMLADEEI
jgi:hypothetical protein